jgi:hypothetical protein
MRLIGRRDFAWDIGFPGLDMNTALMCLQLMGMYPRPDLLLVALQVCSQAVQIPVVVWWTLFHQCLCIYKVEMRRQPISVYYNLKPFWKPPSLPWILSISETPVQDRSSLQKFLRLFLSQGNGPSVTLPGSLSLSYILHSPAGWSWLHSAHPLRGSYGVWHILESFLSPDSVSSMNLS